MSGDVVYVPILKGRAGEYGALREMPAEDRSCVTPLVEIPPVPWDYNARQPAKTIDQHLLKVGDQLERAWGTEYPLFVDLLWIEDARRLAGGGHPLDHVFAMARAKGVLAVPVTGPARDGAYQSACRQALQADGRGVCVRLQSEDIEDYDDLARALVELLDYLGARASETDLILDLKALPGSQQSISVDAITDLVEALPTPAAWRSFTLSGTAFPEDLMGLPPQNLSVLPRTEWHLWRQLTSTRSLPRNPTFGDYAIAHPQPSEVDPRIMRPSASIRYTTEEGWLILKGRNLRQHSFQEFRQVSGALLNEPAYSGAAFSWGDAYVRDCAAGSVGTGNLTTWRKVGTSHHVAFVLRQLASLS